MINKNDLRKAISSIAISNAKRNTIYKAFSDLDSITKEEFDSVKSDISKVVESMLTKDTVGKANGVASLDSNGSVPIEQLSNIDTTLFLIVRELPTTDIKTNKIYLVPNQDGEGNNVYIEYLYVENVWEKLGEFKPEVNLSEYVKSNEIYQCIKKEYDSSKRGANSIAIDDSAQATKDNSIAIGNNAYTDAYWAIVLGYNAKVTAGNSIAIGKNAQITNGSSIAIGFNTNVSGSDSIAIGENAHTNSRFNVVLGYNAEATSDTSIALGSNAKATDIDSIALGPVARAIGDSSIALGIGAKATAANSVALGSEAGATKNNATALGHNAKATGMYSIALGYNTKATKDYSIVVGTNILETGINSMALGSNVKATGDCSIALGNYAEATGDGSTTLGSNANATGVNSTALGCCAQATGNASTALGFYAVTSTVSKYALGGMDDNKQVIFNLEEITYSQYGNKKYLIGLGGYDGTNITINNEAGEKVLNPNIKSVQDIINSKADLVDGKLKAEQLPKLVNITTASTAEEVVTKFNALLADLKAKGYM